tara:strand:+ start:2229 stop:2342 length:114 start_codon:yes stop_codon:yes gene_type:complete
MPEPLQAVYYAKKEYETFFSNATAEGLHHTNLMPRAT